MRKTMSIVLNTVAALAIAVMALRYVVAFFAFSIVNSLQTQIALAVAAMMAVAFAMARQRVSLVLGLAALALAGHSLVMKREFAIHPTAREIASGPDFRILSFNMLGTNWKNSTAVADTVIASRADIAVVLEGGPMLFQLTRIARTYPYRIGCGALTPTCDLIVFSKVPLADIEVMNLSELRRDRFMTARVTLGGTTVRFIAAHLTKPYFDIYHELELLRLKALTHNETGPMILAGDFNSGTIAPDMQDMLRVLSLRTVPGEPGTWPVEIAKTGLGVAIDHIYSRPPVVPLSVDSLPTPLGSNHFGLVADFVIRR